MSVPKTTFTPPASNSWIGFEPCCGGNILYFSVNGTTNPPTPGINIYNGISGVGYDPITDSYVGLSTQCYRIFRGLTSDPSSPITGANYLNLNVVPTNFPGSGVYTWDSTTTYETPCGDETITCPTCPTPLYVVWPCDGSLVPTVTDTDLSAYVNDYATIQVDPAGPFDCYYVVNWSVNTNLDPTNPIPVIVDGDITCSCECTCYEIVGSGKLYYIDCDGVVVATTISGYWKGCSLVYPQVPPSYIVTNSGNCVDNECPLPCYELTDCDDQLDPIYTTSISLGQYAILGQVVQIQGYDNCWIVNSVVDCDCAIDVVVLQAYDTCEECNPAPNYLLTNCDDLGTSIYTSSDLSAYVGQVINVQADCPGCWIVEEYPNPIPSDVPVSVQSSFLDCEACKTTYYLLEDCHGVEPDIITSTDLSAYVGDVITLEWCPTTCWTVSVSESSLNAGNLGDIAGQFRTCEECITSFPCVCSTVRNDNAIQFTYEYVDCYGVIQSVTLEPGQTSNRTCLIKWLQPEDCNCLVYTYTQGSTVTTSIKYATGELINNRPSWDATPGVTFIYYDGTQWIINNSQEEPQYYLPPSDAHCPEGTWHPVSSIPVNPPVTISTVKCKAYYTFYGECNNGVCPPPVYIKRGVKPGYNTPACSADKYEKISCKASQALYRNVLELRYGISNCCPEEDEYWLVKKELIDLAALYNPDYPCAPGSSCGCDCPASDCSCSGPKTCNS
jgi:hypothetical protein